MKSETGKKQDVMTLSDSDDVQTISSGSDDNKEKEKVTPGSEKRCLNLQHTDSVPYLDLAVFPLFILFFFASSCCCCSGSGVTKKQVAVKSTRGIALKGSHGMMVKSGAPGGGGGTGGHGGKTGQQVATGGGGEDVSEKTRLFFGGDGSCYVIDAKLEGNLGRYLNVSEI